MTDSDPPGRSISRVSSACVAIALATLSASAHSESLLELWELAQTRDGKYLSAQYDFEANQEATTQARSQLLPQLSYMYEEKETDQTINDTENEVFDQGSSDFSTTTQGFKLTQSVYDYSRWKRFSQSKLSVDRAEVEFTLARQELMLRLSEAYFQILEREDQLETVQAEKAAMNQHLTLAEARLRNGLGKRVDVDDAKARSLNAVAKEFELKSRLSDSEYALREVIGTMPGDLLVLRPDVSLEKPVPDDDQEWVKMANEKSLEIQALNFQLKEADEEIKVLRGGHFPTLDLVVNANNTDTDGSVFGGGSDIDNTDIALQFNLPLYQGGRVSSEVRQATKKRYSVLEELNDKRRVVERSTQDAFNRIHTAIVQIGALEASVTAQERLVEARLSGYRTGKNSLLNVLDAQNDLSRARQALTKARYDYVLATLRLKFAVGDLRESDLVMVNNWLAGSGSASRGTP